MSLQMVISYILLFMKQGDENGFLHIYVILNAYYMFFFFFIIIKFN